MFILVRLPTIHTWECRRLLRRAILRSLDTELDDSVSRLTSLFENSTTLESFNYLGLGTVVRRAHPEPDVDLTYIKQSGESEGDAGDQYTGLDRFGRIVDQRWLDASSGSHTDRFQYGYDRNSNRTYRENLIDAVFSELYAYDDYNQLTSFDRGQLNATKDGIVGTPSRSQDWDLDALGNWDSLTNDGGSDFFGCGDRHFGLFNSAMQQIYSDLPKCLRLAAHIVDRQSTLRDRYNAYEGNGRQDASFNELSTI